MRKNHQEGEFLMPRRSYPYGRESHPKQRHGDGPARQADFAAEISEEEGWCLDDTYHFADIGRSGFHGEHLGPKGHLTRFLTMVRNGTITSGSVLIIENLDRLSRQEVDLAYDVFREILRAGIWIATRQPRRIYKRENTGLMDLMEPIWLFYLAHEESAKKSMRVAHVWQTRRRKARESNEAHGGYHPNWLRRTATGYEVSPQNAGRWRRSSAC
jgi:DNA invertase Pin-like site-specific DNA recombinase